jgi:hypothetical protein
MERADSLLPTEPNSAVRMNAFPVFIEPTVITTVYGKHPYFNFPESTEPMYVHCTRIVLLMQMLTCRTQMGKYSPDYKRYT